MESGGGRKTLDGRMIDAGRGGGSEFVRLSFCLWMDRSLD